MKVIRHKSEGDITIVEDTHLLGMIVGSVRVSEGTLLELDGTVTGTLILENGSKVQLRGIVTGDVLNGGGYLEVYGMVGGSVTRKGGKTIIDSKAVIRGGTL